MRDANSTFSIRLANVQDVPEVAVLSRDLIENGLGWSWTEARVARCLRERNTNVAVAHGQGVIQGFAIMRYTDDEAYYLKFWGIRGLRLVCARMDSAELQ